MMLKVYTHLFKKGKLELIGFINESSQAIKKPLLRT